MEQLRERFLRTYSNVPLAIRDDVIYVIDDEATGTKKPISWDVAFIEVQGNGSYCDQILKGLEELELI